MKRRNPYYNSIPQQQVIPNKKVEPEADEWDELLLDMLAEKNKKAERVVKSDRARNRREEARHAKENRLYGE